MYSNFITPPDIVEDDFINVALIDLSIDDIELIIEFCKYADQSFNIYLYRYEMNLEDWLAKVSKLSDAIILNLDSKVDYDNLLRSNKTYYYGSVRYASPAVKINNPLDYFVFNHAQNK